MYIRIQDDSIRYRVSRDEANQLVAGKVLQSSLTLSPSHSLSYEISTTHDASSFEFNVHSNGLLLSINRDELQKEIEGRPSKQGLVFTQSFTEKEILISLEIDLKNK